MILRVVGSGLRALLSRLVSEGCTRSVKECPQNFCVRRDSPLVASARKKKKKKKKTSHILFTAYKAGAVKYSVTIQQPLTHPHELGSLVRVGFGKSRPRHLACFRRIICPCRWQAYALTISLSKPGLTIGVPALRQVVGTLACSRQTRSPVGRHPYRMFSSESPVAGLA